MLLKRTGTLLFSIDENRYKKLIKMVRYNKYNIKGDDSFNASDFPKVQDELDILKSSLVVTSAGNNAEMVISFLKDHALKQEWIKDNPELTDHLTGRYFGTTHIEALFESCSANKPFRESFEQHIGRELTPAGIF